MESFALVIVAILFISASTNKKRGEIGDILDYIE
jgi:hypothetical protein